MSWQGRGAFVRDTTAESSAALQDDNAYEQIMNRLQMLHDEVRNLAERVCDIEHRQPRSKR